MPDLYRPPAGVLFPFGHLVGDIAPPHVRHLFAVPSIAKFRSDIDYFCRTCRPLQIEELENLPRMRHRKPSTRSFILSFDDGMSEVYDVIVPILREKGLPAIFFLNSTTVDNRELMWRHKVSLLIEESARHPSRFPPQLRGRPGASPQAKLDALRFADRNLIDELAKFFEIDYDEYLRTAKPYLTSEQIVSLAREGFVFGAHSHSHPYFHEMPVEEQEKQIFLSVQFIRSLGLPCRYFAFPFHDDRVPVSLFRYMTDLNLVLSFGSTPACVDSVAFSFQRFALDGEDSRAAVPGMLRQISAKSILRGLTGTATILRN